MSVSVKQLTVNTKVNQVDDNNQAEENGGGGGGGMSIEDLEAIVEECMIRVRELIKYELRP